MAVSKQNLGLTSGLTLVRDTDSDATSEDNVNSGVAVIYLIEVDNTLNANAAVYTKLYNSTGPTVGTTDPEIIVLAPKGKIQTFGVPEGISFGTGLSFATVTTAGTAGTTSPTGNVGVKIVLA